ncbi:MAG: FAD-dependent oxidoreductase [Aquabacterium sp.]|nr:FAD-dependent oxidoreductase [Aquabacterium sp.]
MNTNTLIPVLDLAIVGAGVSGLYSGWRWLTSPQGQGSHTAVFELSERVGGRLLSVTPPGMPEARIELGGMRFTTGQKMVQALVAELQLQTEPFAVSEPVNMAYLRGQLLRTADLAYADRVPYDIPAADHDGFKTGFTALAAERYLRKVLHKPEVDLKTVDWDAVAKTGRYEGHAVTDLAMRYIYNQSVSHEAFQFAEDTSGYDSIFYTWSAADGFPWNLDDYGASIEYKRLRDGYECVPTTLCERYLEAGGALHMAHRLTHFDTVRLADGSEGVALHLAVTSEGKVAHKVVHARRLVLAMPRRSLELIAQTGSVLGEHQLEVHKLIRSVTPIPLFKLALCYRHRWWEDMGITQGQSVTDLPVRQCYYWPVGDDTTAGAILIYNDGLDLEYWAGLRDHPDQFQNEPHDAGHTLPQDEWAQHPAPALMVHEAHRQLLAIHGLEDSPARRPYAAAFMDWGDDPYGGGANFWPQYVDSHDVSKRIVQPAKGKPVYICGEAYSHAQGWVEGALATAEDMLQNHLGLQPPAYLGTVK